MKKVLIIAAIVTGLSVHGQPNKLSDIPGEIKGLPVNGAFKGVEGAASAVKEFNETYTKLLNALKASKTFSEPIGFETLLSTSISQFHPQLGQKRYRGWMSVFLKAYLMSKSGLVKPEDHASSSIKIFLNDPDFFSRTAGFFKTYDAKYKIPHPFQKIPIVDSTPYYTEYSFKGYGFTNGYYPDFSFRSVTRSNRPIFIPFTTKAVPRVFDSG